MFAEAGALFAIDDLLLQNLQAHFVQSTILAYDKTNGSGGGGGGGGFWSGFEARAAGRGAGAEGGISGLAGLDFERRGGVDGRAAVGEVVPGIGEGGGRV